MCAQLPQPIKPSITSASPPPAMRARTKSGYELFVDDQVKRVELACGPKRNLHVTAAGRGQLRAKRGGQRCRVETRESYVVEASVSTDIKRISEPNTLCLVEAH